MYSLAPLHTFGFPSRTGSLQHISSVQEIQLLARQPINSNICILGDGSNTIFLEDFRGQVVHIAISGLSVTETADSYLIEAGAGENWHNLVMWCVKHKIYGFENLALIPGTVGAAPIQNIGAYGVEIAHFVDHVEYVCLDSGERKTLSGAACQFAYRDSIFKHTLASKAIISKVIFALPKDASPISHYGELAQLVTPGPEDILKQVVNIRRRKLPDPQKIGNAGSFFKNPIVEGTTAMQLKQQWPDMPLYPTTPDKVKIPAAWLIDTLGFKGKSVGGIRCHPTQALVLTNMGNGTGEQLLSLAREITQVVSQEFGIRLENEVRLIGALGPVDL